jgi:hypothetical protein
MTLTIKVKDYLLWLLLTSILIFIIFIMSERLKEKDLTIARLGGMVNERIVAMIYDEHYNFKGQVEIGN